MPFMVMIKIVSSLIQPLTCSVQLATNMIAGRMLMSLLNSSLISPSTFMFGGIFFFTVMTHVVLWLVVSMIQSYVFGTLWSSYSIGMNSPIFKFTISTISYR